MNEELKIIIKTVTDSAKKGIKDVKNELDGLGKEAKGVSGKIGTAFKAIGKSALAVVGAVVAIGAALVALGKNTLGLQKEQAKLVTAFQAAGSSAKQAGETYNQLFRFLGDSGKATEAASHLAKITTNQQDLAQWTKIAQGIYATFGDSLPIEGLTEAANETLRVGKVTSSMADALNWAGVSEDEMNAKLATTNSLEERELILRSTLNDLYNQAAEIYEKNNQALLDYNESQARLDTTMAQAGAAVTPLMTALNNLGSAFFTALKPAIDAIVPILSSFVNMITKAIQAVMSFFSAITGKSSTIKAVGEIGGAMKSAATGAQKLGSGMGGAEKAAKGAAKAAEEAKKSTQGFDELNIVSSGKSSNSGGSGGGGASAPGYTSGGGGGLVDTASFGTEVEESKGLAHSLADDIKEVFGKIAEVFDPSISAWSGAFETVKQSWNEAKPDFINGATEIQSALSTFGSYLIDEFVPDVVNSFSTNLAPVLGDLAGFSLEEAGEAFSWFGETLNTTTNDIILPAFESIKTVATDIFDILGTAWEDKGGGFLTEAGKAFENIRGHIDNFYNSTFKPIFDKVKETFDYVWAEGLKPLYENFVNAVLTIGTELLTLYNETLAPIVDWIVTNIFPPIVEVIEGLIETVGNIFVAISDTVSGVIDVIEGIVTFLVGVFTLDWEKAWEGIQTAFDGFSQIFSGIVDTITEVLQGIADFIVDTVAAAFEIAWAAIKEVWDVVSDFFQGIWDDISETFENVGTWFNDKFTEAWDFIEDIFTGMGTWFQEKWDEVTEVFTNIGTWFSEKFTEAWNAITDIFDGIGSYFSGLWTDIKTAFTELGTNIGNAISDAVKSGINGVISLIENTINSAIGLINGAINLINKLPGVSVGKISKLSLPRLAKGGIIDSATLAIVGEQGKEAVVPLENNTEWMDKLADRLSERDSAPSKIILTIDGRELGWASINSINKITKQTGTLQLAVR